MKTYLGIWLALIINFTILSTDQNHTISVIIPCIASHIKYLSELLDSIANQTLIPNEVVISISQITKQNNLDIEMLKQQDWPFKLIIKSTYERKFAGENRNIAIQHSTGDLIICQDADDLAHPQRIEIIHQIFSETQFDLLLHYFSKYRDKSKDIHHLKNLIEEYQNINFTDFNYINLTKNGINDIFSHFSTTKYIKDNVPFSSFLPTGVHLGNCAFNRKVFDKIKYTNRRSGQDYYFVRKVISHYNNIILVNIPLVFYIIIRTSGLERKKN